uniref:Uncharacterized protein n=1 Tax=Arundo donax TaxID=35708 RepID=A0A0A8YSD7_ARUDO
MHARTMRMVTMLEKAARELE